MSLPHQGLARVISKSAGPNEIAAAIDNVRLWDRDPLLQTFGQLQEIRTYYDFVSVDDDRYWIDGQYRQVLVSPGELNAASLPTRTFINERLTFTHGMGLTLGPVNQVTPEGLPVLFIKDLPPASSVSLRVTRPELYFGELTDSWVVTRTHQREFDYPSGEQNIYTSYTGTGGVPVGSFLRRLVLAAYFRSLKVLLSSDITSDSRALTSGTSGCGRARRCRSSYSIATPTSSSAIRAGSAGSSTPIPRRAATPTRSRSTTAPTTCATA